MKQVLLIVVGWALTWTSAAVGLSLYDRIFRTDVVTTAVAAPPVAPPLAVAAPALETSGASEQPVADPAAETPPHDPAELSCKDRRFRAIRRAIREYCRAPESDDSGAYLCPEIAKQLNCRRGPHIFLEQEHDCHPYGSITICHDYLASTPHDDEIVPYVALNRSAGRWQVVRIEYDDLERP